MPTKFLLPCTCGAKLTIESSQAGQSVPCACGAVLSVPTMREIARLERLEQAAHDSAPPSWSPLQGLLFASGLLITLAGLLTAAYFGVSRAQVAKAVLPDVSPDYEKFEKAIAPAATGDEVYERWKQIEAEGLGHQHPPPQVIQREILTILTTRIWISLVAAAIGACLAGSSFLVGSRRPAQGRPTR